MFEVILTSRRQGSGKDAEHVKFVAVDYHCPDQREPIFLSRAPDSDA